MILKALTCVDEVTELMGLLCCSGSVVNQHSNRVVQMGGSWVVEHL